MKVFSFRNITDFVDKVTTIFYSLTELDELNDISVIAKYENMKVILQQFICYGFDICSIQLNHPDVNCYKDEFVLHIIDGAIFVEPMKHDGKYLSVESTVAFILDDCNSRLISAVDSNYVYETRISDDESNGKYKDLCVCNGCNKCVHCNQHNIKNDSNDSVKF